MIKRHLRGHFNPDNTGFVLTLRRLLVKIVGHPDSTQVGKGTIHGTVSQAGVNVPLQASGSCQILSLTLGPLHLNLLGLVIDLNQVVLTITAVPGAGNLLGNPLCDVANLLNAGGPVVTLLTSLSSLLNQILAAL